ncbi:MAG: DUF86 domain-containing protein [Trueperaceae bacterium]|nr:DUF86 domain-containing protein [Trueperaceae bacterium]
MVDDIVLNKKVTIERCITQIRAYYARDDGLSFEEDYMKQDAIGINLQRLCESAIDIANRWIRVEKLGVPRSSAEAFALLHRAKRISKPMSQGLQAMVGFRNVLVHNYRELDLNIMLDVIHNHLNDSLAFANLALDALSSP